MCFCYYRWKNDHSFQRGLQGYLLLSATEYPHFPSQLQLNYYQLSVVLQEENSPWKKSNSNDLTKGKPEIHQMKRQSFTSHHHLTSFAEILLTEWCQWIIGINSICIYPLVLLSFGKLEAWTFHIHCISMNFFCRFSLCSSFFSKTITFLLFVVVIEIDSLSSDKVVRFCIVVLGGGRAFRCFEINSNSKVHYLHSFGLERRDKVR